MIDNFRNYHVHLSDIILWGSFIPEHLLICVCNLAAVGWCTWLPLPCPQCSRARDIAMECNGPLSLVAPGPPRSASLISEITSAVSEKITSSFTLTSCQQSFQLKQSLLHHVNQPRINQNLLTASFTHTHTHTYWKGLCICMYHKILHVHSCSTQLIGHMSGNHHTRMLLYQRSTAANHNTCMIRVNIMQKKDGTCNKPYLISPQIIPKTFYR